MVVAAVLRGLGVAAGAFGAHGLKSLLSPERLAVFETAVCCQVVHALTLLVVGLMNTGRAGWAFSAGPLIFSGSLYLLVLTDHRSFGVLTPIGGLLADRGLDPARPGCP